MPGSRVFFYPRTASARWTPPPPRCWRHCRGFAVRPSASMARARTYDALARKAKAGHVTGGTVYGYQQRPRRGPRRAADRGRRGDRGPADLPGLRERRRAEGARRGAHPRRRARADASAPRRMPGWSSSAIHAMLGRELYRGVVSWGRAGRPTSAAGPASGAGARRPSGSWSRSQDSGSSTRPSGGPSKPADRVEGSGRAGDPWRPGAGAPRRTGPVRTVRGEPDPPEPVARRAGHRRRCTSTRATRTTTAAAARTP